ncbi:MAG: hypothetical protein OET90_00660, partial [Desulfuromonadales bacterium]|nr:hypothetical protein [Desulfuromonadales bacterium]
GGDNLEYYGDHGASSWLNYLYCSTQYSAASELHVLVDINVHHAPVKLICPARVLNPAVSLVHCSQACSMLVP